MIELLKDIFSLLLGAANICVLGYAFYRFTRKPHDSMEDRVTTLEVKSKEHDEALHKGNDRFREQSDMNEVFICSHLALLEFEMQYCLVENKQVSKGLEEAKEKLNKYLAIARGRV